MTTLQDLGLAFAKYRKKLGRKSSKAVKYPSQLQTAVRVFRQQHPNVQPVEIAEMLGVSSSSVVKWSKLGDKQAEPASFVPVEVVGSLPNVGEFQGTKIDCGKLSISFGVDSHFDEVAAVIKLLLAG